MNFTCQRENLLNAINIVSKAVSNRTTLPILECILLTVSENGFKLTANNLELGIETAFIDANVEESGIIAIEAKIFSEIIRRLNGNTVTVETDEKNIAIISSNFSEFKIAGQNGEDFPMLPTVEKKNEYSLNQNDLRNMIRQTIFSIAQDESKPVLTGELLEMSENSINMVSVDGYRISYKKCSLLKGNENIDVIVPGKTLNEISKILSTENEDTVSIYVTDKHVLFDLGKSIVVSRIIEGEYIKYKQSFTEDFKTRILVNRSEFISSLERASLISRDSKKIPVKLEIGGNRIIINSNAELGTAHEELDIECDGDGLKIAFNPRYLIDALKAIDEDKVAIQFTASLSPAIIKPLEGDEYKYLILPLRM